MQEIHSRGMSSRVFVQSFEPQHLRWVRELAPELPLGLLRSTLDPDPVAIAKDLELSAYNPSDAAFQTRPGIVADLHAAGVAVNVWTVDDRDPLERAGEGRRRRHHHEPPGRAGGLERRLRAAGQAGRDHPQPGRGGADRPGPAPASCCRQQFGRAGRDHARRRGDCQRCRFRHHAADGWEAHSEGDRRRLDRREHLRRGRHSDGAGQPHPDVGCHAVDRFDDDDAARSEAVRRTRVYANTPAARGLPPYAGSRSSADWPPPWASLGYDEINWTYTPQGCWTLQTIGGFAEHAVATSAHNIFNSGTWAGLPRLEAATSTTRTAAR